jgi:hypothetical protein
MKKWIIALCLWSLLTSGTTTVLADENQLPQPKADDNVTTKQ